MDQDMNPKPFQVDWSVEFPKSYVAFPATTANELRSKFSTNIVQPTQFQQSKGDGSIPTTGGESKQTKR